MVSGMAIVTLMFHIVFWWLVEGCRRDIVKELNLHVFDTLASSTNEEGLRRYVMLITLLLQQGTSFNDLNSDLII